ncbi:MAG: 16S rRNA (guanine(527)-N(7))-methyltransferase RsmG [Alphaproteobacteria bacterium]|nr:16S rRNA (guanine(527)-N(7))-methyltransferase RsmG [Alphaproteobacteria bacterium]
MTPEAFQAATGVADQTIVKLETYLALLRKWQARINLVGASTMDDPWRRHFLDSVQLLPLLPDNAGPLVDLGSGAGIPGLILATCGVPDVHLVESSARKCVFLREAARLMDVGVTVHAARLDAVSLGEPAAVVTARALAPLGELLGFAARFRGPNTLCLFFKGQDVGIELTEAAKSWNMTSRLVDSLSDPSGRIVVVEDFSHV